MVFIIPHQLKKEWNKTDKILIFTFHSGFLKRHCTHYTVGSTLPARVFILYDVQTLRQSRREVVKMSEMAPQPTEE